MFTTLPGSTETVCVIYRGRAFQRHLRSYLFWIREPRGENFLACLDNVYRFITFQAPESIEK